MHTAGVWTFPCKGKAGGRNTHVELGVFLTVERNLYLLCWLQQIATTIGLERIVNPLSRRFTHTHTHTVIPHKCNAAMTFWVLWISCLSIYSEKTL